MALVLTRNLALVSPNTTGRDVLALQGVLKTKQYYKGDLDGIYGELTAQAVQRAKYWLGYAVPDQIAGPAFAKLLTGQDELSAEQKARVRKRKREAEVRVTAQQEIAMNATHYLGREEDPHGSNHVPGITDWYRGGAIDHQPWCAIFVSRCCFEAGIDFMYHYCPTIVADARAGRNGLTRVKFANITTGVIVPFDFERDGRSDHVGIVVEERHLKTWVPNQFAAARRQFGSKGANEFWTIEGNTLVGNDRDGGHVMIRLRSVSIVAEFAKAGRLIKK